MSKCSAVAVTALATLLSASSLAHGEENAEGAVTCLVTGYDVTFVNEADDTVAAGTVLEWSVPFARVDGRHTLVSDLEPGARLFLSAALGSNFLTPDAACHIDIEDRDE